MPTTELQTIQATINAIAEKLGALKERPCRQFHDIKDTWAQTNRCGECGEMFSAPVGVLTDPRYQAAWELLVVQHHDCLVLKQSTCDMLLRRYWGDCHGIGVAVLPITTWPWPNDTAREAGVVGLLEGVVRKLHDPRIYAYLVNWKRDPNYIPEPVASDWYMRGVVPFRWPDPDDAEGLGKAIMDALG